MIEFDANHPDFSLNWLLNLRDLLLIQLHQQVLQLNTSYNSLLIIYSSTIINSYSRILSLKQYISGLNISHERQTREVLIPTCYEDNYSIDFSEFESQKNCTKSELIQLHSSRDYRVHFIGFLPGFPYLSNVDKKLEMPRRSVPRPKIEAGSVGIAGRQTGIYPTNSPGGWQIIGQTPLCLFDANLQKSLFKAGDSVRFKSISDAEFKQIKQEVNKDFNYQNQYINGA